MIYDTFFLKDAVNKMFSSVKIWNTGTGKLTQELSAGCSSMEPGFDF